MIQLVSYQKLVELAQLVKKWVAACHLAVAERTARTVAQLALTVRARMRGNNGLQGYRKGSRKREKNH